MGSDAAPGLDTWKRPDELRALATTVVVERPGSSGGRPPQGWPAVVVEVEAPAVSSAQVRARVAAGQPVCELLPEAVEEIVRAEGLYGAGAGSVPVRSLV